MWLNSWLNLLGKKEKVLLKVEGQSCVRQHGLSSQWVPSAGAAEHHASITYSSPWVVSSYVSMRAQTEVWISVGSWFPLPQAVCFHWHEMGLPAFWQPTLAKAEFLSSVHFPELCRYDWINVLSTAWYMWLLKCCLQHPLIIVEIKLFFHLGFYWSVAGMIFSGVINSKWVRRVMTR